MKTIFDPEYRMSESGKEFREVAIEAADVGRRSGIRNPHSAI